MRQSSVEDEVENEVQKTVAYCKEKDVVNTVEILRCLQGNMVNGRSLDTKDPTQAEEGDTNFILVDRNNLFQTAFDEVSTLKDLRQTLEVQFHNEVMYTSHFV
jgi:hypothetical protein